MAFKMKIYAHKTTAMQNMLTAVSRGYVWHVSGVVDAARLEALEAKFADLYGTTATVPQRYHRKKIGEAGARFFAYPVPNEPRFFWWLLLTDGASLARDRERLLPVTDKRQPLMWGEEYEAVRLPGPDTASAWTWRMTTQRVASWRAEISAAVRQRRDNRALDQVMNRLARLPGFKGVRAQVKDLYSFAKGEWTRIKRGSRPFNDRHPPGYVRYRADEYADSAVVAARLLAGKKPFSSDAPMVSPVHGPEREEAVPTGARAARALIIRHADEIKTYQAEGWTHEAVRVWLCQKYGDIFDIETAAFRMRLKRALQAAEKIKKSPEPQENPTEPPEIVSAAHEVEALPIVAEASPEAEPETPTNEKRGWFGKLGF